MTCIKCRICGKVIVDNVFTMSESKYSELVEEHKKIHTIEEITNIMYYMSHYE